ncbi:MAG: type II toxin-antitoxin system RelE/ParE family toxin [Pirellulales bacterium]|nr:type II toxin-antitoxin system RelE/ParE family toxin [Pirellulales bacterium]
MNYPNLELHPEADAEIDAAFDWYAEQSFEAAFGFLEELDHAVAQVMSAPDRWAVYLHGTRRFIMKRYPFVLVYRTLADDRVQIVAVAHGRRNPGYWHDRVID